MSAGSSGSEPTQTSAAGRVCIRLTPIVRIPARRPASMPVGASSTTMERPGSAPRRDAARRKTSGSGLPCVTSSAATSAAKYCAHLHRVHQRLEVEPGRRGRDGLTPALGMKPRHPLAHAGQRLDAVRADEGAEPRLLLLTEAAHAFGIRALAQPPGQDQVVPLAEGVHELIVRDRRACLGHHVAPGLPVELGRVHQRAIEVPEYGFDHGQVGTSVTAAGGVHKTAAGAGKVGSGGRRRSASEVT